MATTVKRIFQGFKRLTRIFVVKEHEMEIGYPTDVKHVAHIGLDGTAANAPSWEQMEEFHASTEISSTSLSNQVESTGQFWASDQEKDVSRGLQASVEINVEDNAAKDALSTPKASKKTRQKKREVSSPPPATCPAGRW